MVGQPAVADVDGDGGVDLILTSGVYKETSTNPRIREYWVDAVSGRTAESLWRYTIDSQHCPRAAVVSEFDAKQLVVLTAGKTLITIEAATGKAGPILHSFPQAIRQWELADLNGDDQDEMLLCDAYTLSAVSPIDPKPRWQHQLKYGVSHILVMAVGDGQTDIFLTGSMQNGVDQD